ncbi:glucosaminidase domain-containing protein [Paenibacillus gorillae]|uniref:glucosaminidase domain-containing protein n=1 Tax=Paenibacillus gorillae TaxID=1243662 RepID=UPI0004AFA88C|nr:glucosaminidase domain-containing protein [Paenibacillus gorillae]
MAPITRKQFIEALAPTVIQLRREGGVLLPSVRLAQCLLETGGMIHPWYNLGGIKVGGGKPNAYWQGQAVVKGTWEYVDGRNVDVKAAFRAYNSVYHYMKDQELLLATPRYSRVRSAATPELQAQMLRECGYATDPAYERKLTAIIQQYGLRSYDAASAASDPAAPSEGGAFQKSPAAPILVNGLVAAIGRKQPGGTVWVPARSLGESLGGEVGWTGTQVTINGKTIETVLDVRTGYVPVRELAAALGLQTIWEQSTGTVTLKK